MKMNYEDLGRRIRQIRRESNMTQEQLAEKLGISASFMGHIERGTRVPSLETLVMICNELDVTPDFLLSASLHTFKRAMPAGLNYEERARLSELLHLAQETVLNWGDDGAPPDTVPPET